MAWTDPAALRAQTQKMWDSGALLAEQVLGGGRFPYRLRLQSPSSAEMTAQFDAVRAWAHSLRSGAGHYRLEEREFRHPVLGHNRLPDAAWLDTAQAAFALIGKTKDAARFAQLSASIAQQQPALLPWLAKRALLALDLAPAWPRLLRVIAWLQAHPRPGIYLRQVDVPGVDSKFIESHRSVLMQLLDVALPPEAIDLSATGAGDFCQRYGFCDKPLHVRLRLLDEGVSPYGQDILVTQAAFERLDPPASAVFITENEVNFLAFPPTPNALVVFGKGFDLRRLQNAAWLHQRRVYYWGDIDTHGFAMLDQLRAYLPHALSLLMDETTLHAHADHWGHEPQPHQRDLLRLTPAERSVYDQLRDNRIQPGLRLEQERIGFGWVQQALAGVSR